MATERQKYGLKNAKTSLFFYFLLLIINLISRKYFLEYLGDTVTGLTSTMQSTVGLMNLAEIGITTAIACALFNPVYNKDRNEINRIVSLFAYLFRLVGLAIVALGLCLTGFVSYLVDDGVSLTMIFVSFFTFLFTTSLSYFVNYTQYLLFADQKTYIVTSLQNWIIIAKIALQVWVLYLGAGYYTWLLMEIVAAVVFSWLLNRRVKFEYPWLEPSAELGRDIRHEYKGIFKNLKRIVSHKFAGVVLTSTDTVIIGYAISLTQVTFFYNYSMIISKLTTLGASLFAGSWAGVGNLISENNKEKIKKVFSQYNTITLYLAGVLSICVWILADPFIATLFGAKYVVSNQVFICMVVSMYIAFIRFPINFFLNGYGMYRDVWAAWTEAGLNLAISLVGGMMFGLIGVVLGTAVSTAVIGVGWKPRFLFRDGFDDEYKTYYLTLAKYIGILIVVAVVVILAINAIGGVNITNMLQFAIWAVILSIVVGALYWATLYAVSSDMRSTTKTILGLLPKLKR